MWTSCIQYFTLCECGALTAWYSQPNHLLSLLGTVAHGRLNIGGKLLREGAVPKCTRPGISVLASHGEVPDKPVILTGHISAEKSLHSVGLRLVDTIRVIF